MPEKVQPAGDAFTFGLGGMSTINSFDVAAAIPDDRINKILDERLRPAQDDPSGTARAFAPTWGRLWLRARRRAE